MTQEELTKELYICANTFTAWDKRNVCDTDSVIKMLGIINSHVAEVIGQDEEEWPEVNTVLIGDGAAMERNELRAEQRKRAGL